MACKAAVVGSPFRDAGSWCEELTRPVSASPRPPVSASAPQHGNRDPDRRLRIGFISSNLSGHPEGRFLRPVLANLGRAAVETTCYAAGPRADAVTALLRQLCDR